MVVSHRADAEAMMLPAYLSRKAGEEGHAASELRGGHHGHPSYRSDLMPPQYPQISLSIRYLGGNAERALHANVHNLCRHHCERNCSTRHTQILCDWRHQCEQC